MKNFKLVLLFVILAVGAPASYFMHSSYQRQKAIEARQEMIRQQELSEQRNRQIFEQHRKSPFYQEMSRRRAEATSRRNPPAKKPKVSQKAESL